MGDLLGRTAQPIVAVNDVVVKFCGELWVTPQHLIDGHVTVAKPIRATPMVTSSLTPS